jgi:predicted nucleotidyltransferase
MKLEETIRILSDASVEFVIIGGAAMGLQGSAHLTQDIDFCYARTVKNMERLAEALRPYHPVLRAAPPGLPFHFDAKTIASGLNFTLSTDLGDLDFLGAVSGLGSFQEVMAASDTIDICGVKCSVLSVEGLIKSKTAAGRPGDLYVLPELRALNELKRKTGLH